MTEQHPITPPPELVHQWHKVACKDPYNGGAFFDSKVLKSIATQAAQWGADRQLEADAEWLDQNSLDASHLTITPTGKGLIEAMRPKPQSLKEAALGQLEEVRIDPEGGITYTGLDLIRRALEALPDD